MTGNMKEVCNRIVDRDEALQMSGRFEPLHDPLSSSDRLMGIFRPIVQAFVGTMLHTRHDLSPCRVIGSKLVGDHYPWRPALAPQQLAHQARCRLGVAATLHQNIENETILIDGAPQPMLFATDRNDDLVEIPFVAEPAGHPSADVVGEGATELLRP